MATITYVGNDYDRLAAAMQQLVTMGYFSSVTNSGGTITCKDANNATVLTISASSVAIETQGGTVTTSINSSTIGNVYCCSGGMYIPADSYEFLVITKDNNGGIGVAFTGNRTSSVANVYAISQNDAGDSVTAAINNYSNNMKRVTAVSKVFTSDCWLPDFYHLESSQNPFSNNSSTPPVSVEFDGKNYLWVGYFMIADEEDEGAAT